MNKRFVTTLFVLLFVAAGCSGVNPVSNSIGRIPTAAPTATSQAVANLAISTLTPSPAPEGTAAYRLTNYCDLLDSHDIASLFSSAEVMKPVHQVNQVKHVIFSTEGVSATESSCINYAFHQPGSKNAKMLQVTYWVDIPDRAAAGAWAKVWIDAKAQAAQTVSNTGEDAFYNQGRLTFKEGDIYVTLEAVGTYLNTDTQAGVTQQVEIEKQLAHAAANRATPS